MGAQLLDVKDQDGIINQTAVSRSFAVFAVDFREMIQLMRKLKSINEHQEYRERIEKGKEYYSKRYQQLV